MSAEFNSPKEFREVMDRIFSMMEQDPDMGPKLRDADVPQRFEFSDVDMVVNIRAAADGEERQPALGVDRRRRLGAQGQDDHVLRDRQQVLPGQGEHRHRDRPAADQDRRATSRPRWR